MIMLSRRTLLAGTAILLSTHSLGALAQEKKTLRFSAVFSDKRLPRTLRSNPISAELCSSRGPSSSPSSGAISKWETLRRRTYPSRFRHGQC
jgi:hypothetical protein